MAPLSYEIDTYLVNLFETELGVGNAALDADPLQFQTVIAAVMRDVNDWENLTPPILVVMCRDIDREPGFHAGDDLVHWEKHYPIHLVSIISGTQAEVLGLVKQLEGRVEDVIREHVSFGQLAGDGGERIQDHQLGSTAFQVYPRNNTVETWWGVAASIVTANATK